MEIGIIDVCISLTGQKRGPLLNQHDPSTEPVQTIHENMLRNWKFYFIVVVVLVAIWLLLGVYELVAFACHQRVNTIIAYLLLTERERQIKHLNDTSFFYDNNWMELVGLVMILHYPAHPWSFRYILRTPGFF